MALRRSLPVALAAGVAATLAATLTSAASAATPAATAPAQFTLPAPTGPDQVGTVSLHLVQNGRDDPYLPGRPRELMISLTYPAQHAGRFPTAPYLTPGAWAVFAQNLRDITGSPAAALSVPLTAAHDGAPVDRHRGGLPVVLFTPGAGGERGDDTAIVQDLASHGYLVVTVDHTYGDGVVEFPDGRVVPQPTSVPPNLDDFEERSKDIQFVLDELTAIDHGQNPDVDHHRLPQGLRGALDLNQVGMFAHSIGASTVAQAMLDDPRIKAAAFLDGKVGGQVHNNGLNRPFLFLGREEHTRASDPLLTQFWNNSTGWKREFHLVGSQHSTYNDLETFFSQGASVLGLTPDKLADVLGTIDPARAYRVETTYLDAFFDEHLRHRAEPVLDGPSARFPEMVFEP